MQGFFSFKANKKPLSILVRQRVIIAIDKW